MFNNYQLFSFDALALQICSIGFKLGLYTMIDSD